MWTASPGIQPLCKLRKQWRSLSRQRVVPPKQRSRSCLKRCNMRRLEDCDEQPVEPESGRDGVRAFPGRCVTSPPLKQELTRSGNKVEIALEEEHSLSRSPNRLRAQRYSSCLCADKLRPWVDQWCQKFKSLQWKGQRSLWTCSRWHQGQVTPLCLKVVNYGASNTKAVGSVWLFVRLQSSRCPCFHWIYL